VLWDNGAADTGISVNAVLLIAEKILSGIDDGVPLDHGTGESAHSHDGIEAALDRLHMLFDPYRVPSRFLPWLAACVGLDPPRSWGEHELREAVAGMVPALGLRGLHDGLRRFLGPYRVGTADPRITIDDGARVLFTTPTPGRAAAVHALVSHGPFLRNRTTAVYPGLVDPGCIAATPDGHLLVGDDGIPGVGSAVGPGVWRISRTGGYVDTEDAPPRPHPLGRSVVPAERRLDRPRAVVVEQQAGSWRAYLLDREALYRLAPPDLTTLTMLATRQDLGLAAESRDMVVAGRGRLLVVNRADVVEVDVAANPARVVTRRALQTAGIVPGPLVRLGNHLIVADLRSQEDPAEGPGEIRPADLVLVDRSNPSAWVERRLLDARPGGGNPLISPVALAVDGPDAVLVLDLGLRPLSGSDSADPFFRVLAEPAALYRVQLDGTADPAHLTATGIERITEPGRMTQPGDMVLVDGTVYIADPGQPVGTQDNPLVRNQPGFVAVQVHFSRQRAAGLTTRTRRTMVHDIASIVDFHQPASVVAGRPHVPTEREQGGSDG
jgi:hypothetical protein